MADRPTTARVNTHRRKVTSQLSANTLPSAPSATPAALASAPRLKAHINPGNIIGGSASYGAASIPSPRPGVVRVPSNTSVRTDTPGRTTPRSEVGGPSVTRASPALPQRPLVARAGNGARATPPTHRTISGGSSSSLPVSTTASGSSTPAVITVRRGSSVVGGSSSSTGTPLSRSPQPDLGAFNASTGSRFRAALAGASSSDSDTPTRPVHVRTASYPSGPRSDSSTSQLSSNTTTLSRKVSRQASAPSGTSSPPQFSRTAGAGSAGVPRRRSNETSSAASKSLPASAAPTPPSHSPSSSMDIPHMAVHQATLSTLPRLTALAEVTASSENLTQYLAPTAAPISSSLLSPSTLTPSTLPTPPTLDVGEPNGHSVLEHEPSSNHSSPVRRQLLLGSPPLGAATPRHAHLAHLGLGSLATASAPTSPRLANGNLEGPSRRRNSQLPWNPLQGQAPSFPAPPISPELRTVALPIMTPARTPEQTGYRSLAASEGSRRFSSSSESGPPEISGIGLRRTLSPRARVSPEAVMSWENGDNGFSNGKHRESSSVGRWSGSTLGSEDDDAEMDVDRGELDSDTDDENKLEPVLSVDIELERDKYERKIADLEISNNSLNKINRMLETTKVKQQGEIVRLRRALRDARSGALERPVLERAPSTADPDENDPDTSGEWGDDEMEDPEVEKRWDRLRDLVDSMRRSGEEAVQRGLQETKPHQRVLGWLEVEAMGRGGGSGVTTTAASEVDPAETVSGATETTESTTDMTDTTSERSDAAPTEIGPTVRASLFN